MSILIFIVVLVALILVHEWGHFVVAKWTGMRVDEFGVGFPPRAATIAKKGETEYTINWLPFGGFVRIFGENPNAEAEMDQDLSRAFFNKPKWAQAAVLVAGVTMNVLFAWVLYTGAFMIGMPQAVENPALAGPEAELIITQVLPDSPAATTGLMPGDTLVSLAAGDVSVPVDSPDAVIAFVGNHASEEILLTYERGGETKSASVLPVTGLIDGQPAIGVAMSLVETVALPVHQAVLKAASMTFDTLVAITVGLVQFFGEIFTWNADLAQVTGPVGIVGLVGDASELGIIYLISFAAFISLNLAVINLLPIPALDGGRLLFVLIEAVKGSRVPPAVFNTANAVGMLLLLALMVAVTVSDVLKLVG